MLDLEVRYNRHPKRKNNIKVAGMYEAYKNGRTCQQVGELYGVTRQAVYDVFRSRGYKLRSKELKGLTILDGIKFTEVKGGHLRGTTPRGRMTMQRYVWEKENGKLPKGYVLYHFDRNTKNNTLENLRLIKKTDMSKVFNPKGINQYTKQKNDNN